MDRLKMHSPNKVKENIKKIGELFPNCVTERIVGYKDVVRADGTKEPILEKAIDFDMLKQELSSVVVEGPEERYQFTWPDKKKSILLANAPISATLRPCREESVDFDHTENLYIEGDNLDVLKLLQETYLGKIKMIYIDPPYNTGSDFVYEDDFAENTEDYLANSGQFDAKGNRLFQNTESNGRFHTDWLNMFYPRMKIARDLLSEDGVIVVSIDDNEQDNVRKVMDEIYGNSNLINCFIWNCSTAGGIRPKFASKTHEYLYVYAKNIEAVNTLWAPLSADARKMYTQRDDKGIYRDKDFIFKNKSTNINQKYEIVCPDGEIVHPKNGYIYRFVRQSFNEALAQGLVTFKKTNTGPLLNQNYEQAHWNIYIKKYLGDAMGAPSTLIPKDQVSIYNVGTQCVQDLFDGIRVFENVKPVDVIQYMAQMLSYSDSTIMDFFSGSATTAHSVMQLNVEDGGCRKFIMVQLPEKTDEKSGAYKAGYKNICEIGKERIRRAGRKIKEESPLTTAELDVGFRVLKLDSSNMKDVYYNPTEYTPSMFESLADNIKEDRTPEDLLFQVMLDLGILLSSKIEETAIAGKKVFSVADKFLIACFDADLTDEVITEIAKQKPYYFVTRDHSMASDSVATNFDQIFATYSPDTVRKVL